MTPALKRRLHEYVLLTRLNRPIGTLLLLWPALWALWLSAGGIPDPLILTVFVLGTLLINVLTGTALSGGAVLAAVISGVVFTVLYGIGMYIWSKRQGRG